MDGGTFHGGYGQRTRSQLPAVVERLDQDLHTRRAVMTMWDPLHDLFIEDAHDYPCTISLQFLVRDDQVLLHTHMRSNDVWRGFAYDVFVFTQLQLAVAASLELWVGSYHHHVTSMHMYQSDMQAWEKMCDSDKNYEPLDFGPLIDDAMSIWEVQECARELLKKGPTAKPTGTRMWEWYAKTLT
jgi:thymidylate synthase